MPLFNDSAVEKAFKEFEKANLDFQKTMILIQEVQAEYARELVKGNTTRAQDLSNFIHGCIGKLQQDLKIEKKLVDYF